MTDCFDPKFTARSIEEAGDTLLHGGAKGISFNDMVSDMERLSSTQVKELGNQFQWDNIKPNGLPNVDMSVGVDGHIVGFTFTPAESDTHPTISPLIMVGTGHKDSGVPEPHYVPAPHKHKNPDFQH